MAEPGRVRFGVFAFDAATRELSREGVAVRLQAQPAQALALLIAHAGEVVTRETLRQNLWGEDTFVDFDRGLNFCIAQIRTALGDSADSPRFIRTLPKRGYQFIAPVSQAVTPVAEPAVMAPEVAAPPKSRRALFGAVAGLIVVAASGFVTWRLLKPAPLPPIAIAVTRFDNDTGDPAFTRLADTLTDSVVGELTTAVGGGYGVIGNAAILRAPREGRNLLAIGASLHAGYIVLGQVQRDGAGLRILAHLIRLPDQRHLWVVRALSAPDEAERTQSDLARRIAAEFSQHLEAERARRVASSGHGSR